MTIYEHIDVFLDRTKGWNDWMEIKLKFDDKQFAFVINVWKFYDKIIKIDAEFFWN